jgi:ribosomal protein L11 methyltransferase
MNSTLGESDPVADRKEQVVDRLIIYYLKGHLCHESGLVQNYLGNWQEDDFSFLFFNCPENEQIDRLLRDQPHLEFIDQYDMTYAEWQGGPLQKQTIGPFDILPVWERDSADIRENTLILDPGVVFGNGGHPTTRNCLEALALAVKQAPVVTAQDMGTGTGLLSIAAWKLGVKQVLSVDFNRLAVKTANRNIHLNGADKHILAVQGKAEDLMDIPADLLIANIHFDVMRHIVTASGFLRKKQFILSGLLRSEAMQIENMVKHLPIEFLNHWEQDHIWHTYWGKIG